MKIIIIGGTGTIVKAIVNELKSHEIITVGKTNGDYQVDLEDEASIKTLFEKIGTVDAVISTVGQVVFAPVKEINKEQYQLVINSKILSNLNLFRIAHPYIKEGGSFTITSEDLAINPMPGVAALSIVNAALDAFAKAAALDLDATLRINTVNPHFVKETMEMMGMDSGPGISAADTAKAFRYAVESHETGQMYDVPDYI